MSYGILGKGLALFQMNLRDHRRLLLGEIGCLNL